MVHFFRCLEESHPNSRACSQSDGVTELTKHSAPLPHAPVSSVTIWPVIAILLQTRHTALGTEQAWRGTRNGTRSCRQWQETAHHVNPSFVGGRRGGGVGDEGRHERGQQSRKALRSVDPKGITFIKAAFGDVLSPLLLRTKDDKWVCHSPCRVRRRFPHQGSDVSAAVVRLAAKGKPGIDLKGGPNRLRF